MLCLSSPLSMEIKLSLQIKNKHFSSKLFTVALFFKKKYNLVALDIVCPFWIPFIWDGLMVLYIFTRVTKMFID